jgi:hypothetical protein
MGSNNGLAVLSTRIDFQNRVVLSTSFHDDFWKKDLNELFGDLVEAVKSDGETLGRLENLLFHGLTGEARSRAQEGLPGQDPLLRGRWDQFQAFLTSSAQNHDGDKLRAAIVSVLSYIPQPVDDMRFVEAQLLHRNALLPDDKPLQVALFSKKPGEVIGAVTYCEPSNVVEPRSGIPARRTTPPNLYFEDYKRVAYPVLFPGPDDEENPAAHLLCLPVFDTWVGDVGYGNICAFVHVAALKPGQQPWPNSNVLAEQRWNNLALRLEFVAAELLTAGFNRASSHALEAGTSLPDLLVAAVGYIQNWEAVTVRTPAKKPLHWKRQRTDFGARLVRSNDLPPERSPRDISLGDGIDIWSRHYLPDITEEEMGRYGGMSFDFISPPETKVPCHHTMDKEHEGYVNVVRRTLLRLINLLLLRLRARRASLRNAAVSIMGRNMSHNIGSHVLDAAARNYRAGTQPAATKIADLLLYLQQRMDFLAELATAESYFAAPLSLKDTVAEFVDGASGDHIQRFISATRVNGGDVRFCINQKRPLDGTVQFSSPGGRHGAHALFVILENFIRNVAKHQRIASQCIEFDVVVVDNAESEYISVTVVDTAHDVSPDALEKVATVIGEQFTLLDSEGGIRVGSWGLREMYISAAYLRQIPLVELESPTEPPILSLSEEYAAQNKLGYTFHLLRPDLLTAVFDVNVVVEEEGRKKLSGAGVSLLTADEFEALYPSRGRTCKSREFVWCDVSSGRYSNIEERLSDWQAILPPSFIKPPAADTSLQQQVEWRAFADTLLRYLLAGDGLQAFYFARHHRIRSLLAIRNQPATLLTTANYEAVRATRMPGFVAIFDNHGQLLNPRGLGECSVADILDEWNKGDAYGDLFYESYNSAGLQSKEFDAPTELFRDEALLAALTPVLLVDERAQTFAERRITDVNGECCPPRYPDDASKWRSMWAANIHVPRLSVGLDLYRAAATDVLSWIRSNMDSSPIGFIVIHQTIIEKFSAIEQRQFFDELNQLLSNRAGRYWRLIVCSGRGVPQGVRKERAFVPVDAIFECVDRRPSKVHLLRVLESARAPS